MRSLLLAASLVVVASVLLVLLIGVDRPAPRAVEGLQADGPPAARPSAAILAAPVADQRPAGRSVAVAAAEVADADRSRFGRLDIVVRSSGGAKTGPIEGAFVTVDEAVAPRFIGEVDAEGTARTDARGRVSVLVLPTRTVAIRATHPDGGLTTEAHFTSPFEGRTRKVVLEIAHPSPDEDIAFRVVSLPSRRPLEGARIDAGVSLFTVTGEDGCASLPGSTAAAVEISAPGHVTAVTSVPEDRGPAAPVVVELNRHARLFGHLELPDGGRGRAAVTLDRARELGPQENAIVVRARIDAPRAVRTRVRRVDVDADGRWAIDGIEIPHGDDAAEGLDLWVDAGIHRRRLASDLRLLPGESRIVDDPWSAAAAVEILVRYASGAHVESSMWLSLSEDDGNGVAREVAGAPVEGGRTRLERLPAGTWHYAFHHVGGSTPISDLPTFVHDGGASGEIVLEGFGAIAGRVVGDWRKRFREQAFVLTRLTGSRPRPRPRVVVLLGGARSASIGADGGFRFERVGEGELVEISVGAHVTKRQSDDLDEFALGSDFVPFATVLARVGDLDVVLEVRDD